jgi:hypothetical protein
MTRVLTVLVFVAATVDWFGPTIPSRSTLSEPPSQAGLSDERTRLLAKDLVSKETGTPPLKLNTRRLEKSEEDLLSFSSLSSKIKNDFRVYGVRETGYFVESDKLIYVTASPGSEWYVAVSRSTGERFGLRGFRDAEQAFNRLAQLAGIRVTSADTAASLAHTNALLVYGLDDRDFMHDQLEVRQRAEGAIMRSCPWVQSLDRAELLRTWLHLLESSGITEFGPAATATAQSTYSASLKIMNSSRADRPELWEWLFSISATGACRLNDKRVLVEIPLKSRGVQCEPPTG